MQTPALASMSLACLLAALPQAASAAQAHIKAAIDAAAPIWNSRRMVIVTGPVDCVKGDAIDINVRVSQSSDATGANGTAGATGEGHFNGYCTGTQGTWMAIVKDAGFAFTPGTAHVHAWATAWTHEGGAVKSWDWQRDVKLQTSK